MEEINIQLSNEEYLAYIERWKRENKELISNAKVKKVFTENLPVWNHNGGSINWENSINSKSYFIYEGFDGYITIVDYKKKGQKLTIKYGDTKYVIATSTFKKCALGNALGLINHNHLYNIDEIIETNTGKIKILELIKVKKSGNNARGYKYLCLKCGYIGECYEGNLNFNNQGCSCCSGQVVVENINSIILTAPWMIKYFQGRYDEAKLYTKSSGKKIYPICPDCGRIKNKKMVIRDIYTRHSIGCSCSDKQPYPQKLMHSILEQFKIEFETEKIFDWCKYILKDKIKTGRYDFYFKLNENEYIVETDGGWHSKDNNKSKQTKEESQYIDDEKDRLAKEHGINVIRIECEISDLEYIKSNIINNEKMNELFDFSYVDWLKANEFAMSNLIKQACEIKRNNPKYTTFDIGKIMKRSHTTITSWLKNGHKHGWCEYDTRNIMQNIGRKNGKLSCEEIICTTTGDIFESMVVCEQNSIECFGIKVDKANISAVCRGVRKHTRGLIFSYTKNLSEEEIKQIQEKAKLNQVI